MHLHVLGLGPIGCLIAHNLRRVLPSQHIITLIHKTAEERQYLLEKRAIRVESDGRIAQSEEFLHEISAKQEDTTPRPARVLQPGQDVMMKNDNPIHSLFVALKAQHTLGAIKDLAPRLNSNSTIVLMQNGMGIYEQLIGQVFRNPNQRPHFVLATNTHGVFVKHHYHVIHAGIGSIEFGIIQDPKGRDFEVGLHEGGPDPRLRLSDITRPGDNLAVRYSSLRDTVAALLLMKDLNISWKSLAEMQLRMQRKVTVNAAINPISAVMGCRNGELFTQEYGQSLLRQVCDEASSVFEAQWNYEQDIDRRELEKQNADLSTVQLPTFPEGLTSESLQREARRVAQVTKGNISSMLQDVRRGRKTEVDFINGYLERVGHDYGVPTPVNTALRNLVKLRWHVPLD